MLEPVIGVLMGWPVGDGVTFRASLSALIFMPASRSKLPVDALS